MQTNKKFSAFEVRLEDAMPASRRYKYSNAGLPNNLLQAIGHVAVLWGQIEYIVDSKINEALALPGAPVTNGKLMVPFNQRLALLDQLCKQFLTDSVTLKHSSAIIADLKQLVSHRNLIVHGSVANSKQRRKRRIVYWFRRIGWDTQPRILEKRALTVADVEKFAAKLSDMIPVALLIEAYFWTVEDAIAG
jgi:hypothetical protein